MIFSGDQPFLSMEAPGKPHDRLTLERTDFRSDIWFLSITRDAIFLDVENLKTLRDFIDAQIEGCITEVCATEKCGWYLLRRSYQSVECWGWSRGDGAEVFCQNCTAARSEAASKEWK